jgi:hypothetical protein
VGILWGADGVLATCLSVLVMIYGSAPCAAQLSRNVPGSASPRWERNRACRLFAAGGQGVVAQPGVQMFQFCVALVAGMPR